MERHHLHLRAVASAALVLPLLAFGAPASAPAAAGADRWSAPVWPVRVVRAFDNPEHDWLRGHRGVDLRTLPGAGVRAVGDGRVVYAARLAGRGVIVVDHGALRTTYEPVAATVGRGDRVRRGETIGRVSVGTGHCGTGTCLHLGLKRGRTYLDPRLVLGRATTVLRPW
jgi:murein DD-endopeptidase MepM/ murein hydrolase activator NlpD